MTNQWPTVLERPCNVGQNLPEGSHYAPPPSHLPFARHWCCLLNKSGSDQTGQYLVFTSHVAEAGDALVWFLPSSSARNVERQSLPHMQLMPITVEESKRFLDQFTHPIASYCGYSPSLCWLYTNQLFPESRIKLSRLVSNSEGHFFQSSQNLNCINLALEVQKCKRSMQ